MPKHRVFVDTCIIIESLRTKTWSALCQKYSVETVEKCIEECATGDPLNPHRTIVSSARLRSDLTACHAVSLADVLALTDIGGFEGIDEGELHLMAWMNAHRPIDADLLISTADRAAIRAAHSLGLLDHVQSLEALLKRTGAANPSKLGELHAHFLEKWMSEARMRIRVGVI